MQFNEFGKAVADQFKKMTAHQLFRVQVEKDTLWDSYLVAWPEGTNPIYKKRTEYDCQCCRSFIRTVGGVVSLIDGRVATIWDINIGGHFQVVADALAALVRNAAIDNLFLHTEKSAGTVRSLQQVESGEIITWNHFFVDLPTVCTVRGEQIGPKLADSRATKDVFFRGLNDFKVEDIDTVLDLIAQNSLYRGEENRFAVESFRKLKLEFDKLNDWKSKEIFSWNQSVTVPQSVSRIRNTAIGTLLQDLGEGKDLEYAVKSFETKVAPTNYKRPTSLVTKVMIQKAQATIEELGFTSALERRYANINDITINNILFANRDSKKSMNVFDEMISKVPEKTKNLDKVEEVTIENFLANVLPKADSIEVLFENKHAGNLVSLIAPVDPMAKHMFKWPNNFSWSYTGEVTDSIKEKVKAAGGRVDADLRCSLSWSNYDDLDLHLTEPSGNKIYFRDKVSRYTKGQLDVDMNAGGRNSRTPVENIFFPDRKLMKEGTYKLVVNQFSPRETKDVGFDVEIEYDGVIHSFSYPKSSRMGEDVTVAEFNYTHKGGIEITKSLPSSQTSKAIWGAATQTFQKVNVVMMSPNHWDNNPVGNKHYFFMLDNCLNDGQARGIFNEFLTEDLGVHRKVFEMVGAKMKTDESDKQLSGLGFSSTQRNHLLCRVKGSFERTVKITF
jgi:hypothetical protein